MSPDIRPHSFLHYCETSCNVIGGSSGLSTPLLDKGGGPWARQGSGELLMRIPCEKYVPVEHTTETKYRARPYATGILITKLSRSGVRTGQMEPRQTK